MARSVTKTAEILIALYDENFANDSYESFRITWQDLRGIAGVAKLTPSCLRRINLVLSESGYSLIQFDNFLAVVQESDLSHIRLVPPRLVEQYLYDVSVDFDAEEEEEEDFIVDEHEVENIELDDDDDGLYVEEEEKAALEGTEK